MSLNAIVNIIRTGGCHAIECTKKLFSEVDTTGQIAGLTHIALKALEENDVIRGYSGVVKATEVVRDWTRATRLPCRVSEITSGRAVAQNFFGQFNVVMVFSRLCLIANDFFNSVKFIAQCGGIAEKTGTFLAFGLKDTALHNAQFGLGIGGWGADLISTASQLWQQGPSVNGVINCTQDIAKLAAITVGRFPSIVPNFVKIGIEASVLLLGILKAVAAH